MPHPVADLGRFLAGAWKLERTIADSLAAGGGAPRLLRVAGTAEWTPAGPGVLEYAERGVIELPGPGGARSEVRQAYTWRLRGGGAADVHFADGRVFHAVDLTAGRHEGIHHGCSPDTYVGAFEAAGPDALACRWDVKGPAKDYRSETRFTRLPGGGSEADPPAAVSSVPAGRPGAADGPPGPANRTEAGGEPAGGPG